MIEFNAAAAALVQFLSVKIWMKLLCNLHVLDRFNATVIWPYHMPIFSYLIDLH